MLFALRPEPFDLSIKTLLTNIIDMKMTRIFTIRKAILSILFLWFGITGVYSQDKKPSFTDSRFGNEWWYPLVKKHNIDPAKFTFWGNIKPESGDQNGYIALELGEGSSIKDEILTISNPVFLIKENEESYSLVSAKTASHPMKGLSEIRFENGEVGTYKFNSPDLEPIKSSTFKVMTLNVKTKMVTVVGVSATVKKP